MRIRSLALPWRRFLLAAGLTVAALPANADCAGLSARAAESTRALYVFLVARREAYTMFLGAEANRNANPTSQEFVQLHEAARADYVAATGDYEQTLQKLVNIGKRLERECS